MVGEGLNVEACSCFMVWSCQSAQTPPGWGVFPCPCISNVLCRVLRWSCCQACYLLTCLLAGICTCCCQGSGWLQMHYGVLCSTLAVCFWRCWCVCQQEFDATSESEISIINRLAAERQDNLMWREYRTRLLRNMGLVRGRDTRGGRGTGGQGAGPMQSAVSVLRFARALSGAAIFRL